MLESEFKLNLTMNTTLLFCLISERVRISPSNISFLVLGSCWYPASREHSSRGSMNGGMQHMLRSRCYVYERCSSRTRSSVLSPVRSFDSPTACSGREDQSLPNQATATRLLADRPKTISSPNNPFAAAKFRQSAFDVRRVLFVSSCNTT